MTAAHPRRPVLAIVGSSEPSARANGDAEELGALAAERGWVVITGGRDTGVMAAAFRGAKRRGGLTVGILPDVSAKIAPNTDVAIVTDIGNARNNIIVLSGDVVIACGIDGPGTSSEVSLAIKNGRHVVLLNASDEAIRFFGSIAGQRSGLLHNAASAKEAMDCAEQCVTVREIPTSGA
jgi:uncharacterized protein (TIGR00725 family)